MAQQHPKQPQPSQNTPKNDMASWRPGGEPERAKDVASKGDFGVPVGNGPSPDRDYVSRNTKASDPGAAHPRSSEHDGVRDHGAGAPDSGPGSSSAGDLDPDLLGVGTGGSGIATSGPDDTSPGPDDASRPATQPAQGRNQQNLVGKVGGPKQVPGGSVIQRPGAESTPDSQGADAATNPQARGDDSFAAEISSGEAQGQDLGISPSSDTQGLARDDDNDDSDDQD
jgi:hypothetical protein